MATCPTCRAQYPEGTSTCTKDGDVLLPDAAFAGLERELPAGFLVGEYRIEGKIGEGGFGSVYRAVHPLIGKAAAIKILSRQYSSNPVVVARFIAEARAVNQIRHRNIIDIFSFGALEDGRQYLVMELLDGKPLDRYLQEDKHAAKGRLTPEEAIPILRSIARALDAAHASGILHRDLKPENIFLSFDEDGKPFPKLLDFGIAKLVGGGKGSDPTNAAKTRTGTPMGTPYYMSPEQCRGKDVDHRTDIYSFGVLTHELLTGDIPFRGEDVIELLMKQTTAEPPPMSSVCPAVPSSLDRPVLSMLSKDPAGRPSSAGAAVEALAAAAKEAGFRVSSPLASGPALSGTASQARPGAPPATVSAVSIVSGGVRVTPGSATLESAETLDEGRAPSLDTLPRPHTFGAAAADVRTGSSRRPHRFALLGFAGVGAVVLIGIALVATGVVGGAKAPLASIASGSQVPSDSSASSGAPAASVVADPVPAAGDSSAPSWATEVAVTVNATPASATIWKDGTKIGEAPGPISLPRASGTVKLTIKAEGHKPSEIAVDTTKDATFVVALTKVVRPVQASPKTSASGASQSKHGTGNGAWGEIPSDINEK